MAIKGFLPLAQVKAEMAELERIDLPKNGGMSRPQLERYARLEMMLRNHMSKRVGSKERNQRYLERKRNDPEYRKQKALNQQLYEMRKESKQ